MLGLIYQVNMAQPTGYLNESVKIRSLKGVLPVFSNPVNETDKAAASALAEKILQTKAESDSYQSSSAGRGQRGQSDQPTPNATTKPKSLVIQEQLKKDLAQEIIWLSKLANSDLKDFISEFGVQVIPDHFVYLEEIIHFYTNITFGFGNSKDVQSGFSFSESDIIYGITDFVIRRAKAELSDVYLREWYTKLSDDKIVAPLIPQSLNTFKAFIDTDALNIAKYGDKWKASFQEDLRNIPLKLQDIEYVKQVLNKLESKEVDETAVAIAGGDEIVYNLYLKKPMFNVVSPMANRYNKEATLLKFQKIIVMSDLLMRISGDIDENNNYQVIQFPILQNMDIRSWEIFVKLVYGRERIRLEKIFGEIDIRKNDVIKQLISLIPETVTLIDTFNGFVAGNAEKNLSFDDARKLFDLSFQIIENSAGYLKVFKVPLDNYDTKVKSLFPLLSEIGEGISSQQYGKVLDGTIGILELNKVSDTKILENLARYGSFMVNVISAKSPDEVDAALDELIPKDQYQLKHTKKFSISFSAYPGVIPVGIEIISKYQTFADGSINYKLQKKHSSAYTAGFYLPIGLDFSLPTKKYSDSELARRKQKYGSWNLMIQVLDLGAVLNYRITSDSTENANPNITFQQLLSPGVAIMRHLNDSPIVFGLSGNYTPDLRRVSQTDHTYDSNAFRVFFFIGVDVSFFYLHLSKKSINEK